MQEANELAIALNPVFVEVLKLGSPVFKFPAAIISANRAAILLVVVVLFGAFKLIAPFVSCNDPKFMAKSSVAAVVISLTRNVERGAAVVPAIEKN